jgi:hypothetical protein
MRVSIVPPKNLVWSVFELQNAAIMNWFKTNRYTSSNIIILAEPLQMTVGTHTKGFSV